jgi:hypothetical protein
MLVSAGKVKFNQGTIHDNTSLLLVLYITYLPAPTVDFQKLACMVQGLTASTTLADCG